MRFMNRLEFSCFSDFFVWVFKNQSRVRFFGNPPVEETANSMEQNSCLLSNWCPKTLLCIEREQSPYFYPFMKPRNRFQRMNSASLCSKAGRYDSTISTRFVAPIDCLKIPSPEQYKACRNHRVSSPPPSLTLSLQCLRGGRGREREAATSTFSLAEAATEATASRCSLV